MVQLKCNDQHIFHSLVLKVLLLQLLLEHLEELQTGEKKDDSLTYNTWAKEKEVAVRSQRERECWKPKTVTTTVGNAAKDMVKAFHELKDHLGRNKEIKQYEIKPGATIHMVLQLRGGAC